MEQRKRDKTCSVCGDFAIGYNFGAVACESCKAFFRRTARKAKQLKCLFGRECKIEVTTRRFCPYCRLMKCFCAGMKTCFILDDDAKRVRRERAKRTRQDRTTAHHEPLEESAPASASSTSSASLSTSNTPGVSVLAFPFTEKESGGADQASSVAGATNAIGESSKLQPKRTPDSAAVAPTSHTGQPSNNRWYALINDGLIPEYGQQDTSIGEGNEIVYGRVTNTSSTTSPFSSHLSASSGSDFRNEASQQQQHHPQQNQQANPTVPSLIASSLQSLFPSDHGVTLNPSTSACLHKPETNSLFANRAGVESGQEPMRLLSHYQWTAVNDLRNAYDTSFIEDEFCSNLCRPDITLSSLINTSRFLVRRLINFAKTLTDFSQLQRDCQISLLKGVVLSTLFLLSARHYVVEKDAWLTPKGEVSTQILKVATGMDQFYEEHATYCKDFNALVSHDSNVVALMQTLCLFTPDRPSLDARQAVANIHDRYYLLLKHYLEAKAGFSKGRIQLAAVLTNLGQLESLTINYGHMLMQVDPTKIDPLLLEIFNLTS